MGAPASSRGHLARSVGVNFPTGQVDANTVAQTLPGPGACQIPTHVSTRVWEIRLRQKVTALAASFPPLIPMQVLRSSALGDLRAAIKAGNPTARSDPTHDRDVRLLYIMVRYHYDAAGHGVAAGRTWSVGDLNVILAALHDFPANELPLDDDYRVISDERGASIMLSAPSPLPGAHVVALQESGPGAILLGQGWHQLGEAEQRGTVFHELAHDFAATRERFADWRRPWRQAAAADQASAAQRGGLTTFVSRYAESDIDEDMAESAVAYRYRPALLKVRAPAKYQFLRSWMFDGLEYLSEGGCLAPLALSESAALGAYAKLAHGPPSAEAVRQHIYDCASDPMYQVYDLSAEQCWLLRDYHDAFLAAWQEKAPPDWAVPAESFAGNTYFLTDHLEALSPDIRSQVVARHRAELANAPAIGQ